MNRKIIVTSIERVNKVEQVEYRVAVPEYVSNIDQYVEDLFEEGNFYEKAKIISTTTLRGDIFDEEVVDIKEA